MHQFITEFKTALQADHVRKKDEVKTLMKYLDSHAKTSVGTHTQTLDEAIEILKKTYGNPSLIWNQIKEYISKSLSKAGNWG